MEQLAATKLAADEPGSSNQPGWDLMVDGQPYEGRHLRECEDELVRLADGERGGLGRAVSILRVALRSVHPSRYQTQLRDLLDALQVNRHSGGR